MHAPREITVGGDRLTVEQTEQRYYVVEEADKLAALVRLLEVEPIDRALIFTRTKIRTAQLAESLLERSFQAEALHGDMDQPARETVLRRLRQGQISVLVATDVAARGLDIEGISHVVNYPQVELVASSRYVRPSDRVCLHGCRNEQGAGP